MAPTLPPASSPAAAPARAIRYCDSLQAPLETAVGPEPRAPVHRVEWRKVMSGDPVEINPSIGSGYRVMSVSEWSARWKRNEDFPACLGCGGSDTKEHYFVQTWCRGQRTWASESLCLGCHSFSWRSYRDPGFKSPEQHEKELWEAMARGN